MHRRRELPTALTELALEQAGVVTRQQATTSGLGRHVIERLVGQRSADSWMVLAPGIYFTRSGPVPWLALAWAGVLVGGPGSVLTKLSAATLHGLTDGEPLPIQVLVPHSRRMTDRPWVRFQRQREQVRMASAPALPARTRLEDTVLDLCACGGPADVVDWITRAVQRRLTTPARLHEALLGRRRQRHRFLIEQVLGDADVGVHSQLEYRFARDVERTHRLPTGRRQFRVPGTDRYADVAYDEFALLIELDGRIGHVEKGMWRDRTRDNAHAIAGWLTLRFGWRDVVTDPCAVAAQIAAVLCTRGWTGRLSACSTCGSVRTA
ncbi:MAG: DUF559 domain-containing protein [Actinomycetota bacterium]|nr:DUF559 domain-containing protein [Actinomycetota bacterium]